MVAGHVLPDLKLTQDEERAIVREIKGILAETIHVEDSFRQGSAAANTKMWKEVKARDDFRVYKERKPNSAIGRPKSNGGSVSMSRSASTNSSGSNSIWSIGSSDNDVGIVASVKDPQLPMIVADGYIEGVVDDVLFGALAGDEISWRMRSTYMKDRFADAKILATIVEPTQEDPYRYMGVKWFSREYPPLIAPFLQPRDYLVMEASGTARDPNGQEYGYYLIHPFRHRSLPDFSEFGIHRAQASLVYICRQATSDRVTIFGRGFVDPKGGLLRSLSVTLMAEAITNASNVVETAYAKKLGYFMTREQSRHTHLQEKTTGVCACSRKTGRRSTLTPCRACGEGICSRCTVQRKLIVDMTATDVTESSLPFCFSCVLYAKQHPPRDIAIATVVRPTAQRHVPTIVRL
ncbi:hypothetical protein Poli38472_012581 [Pythium oligandrum]|uniref:FYVE-type domain-containing protein n=1 Tax=Pythium oligandrum TaxID=41045 RepID=A0A8K1CDW9_PYTOL|nr:hypothetical protein Poli38472_012581 [Pythium oligandrum]|eukprot:TMW61390.1 hypothetical protein Poli38472_012581 [Pythium oligandrum]